MDKLKGFSKRVLVVDQSISPGKIEQFQPQLLKCARDRCPSALVHVIALTWPEDLARFSKRLP